MAAPNLISASQIIGDTAVQAVGTSATAIVTNSAESGKAIKINALYLSNVDGTDNTAVDVDIYRSSTAYRLLSGVVVSAKTTIDVISKPIYLKEGDSLRITAAVASDIEAVCSYEEIS